MQYYSSSSKWKLKPQIETSLDPPEWLKWKRQEVQCFTRSKPHSHTHLGDSVNLHSNLGKLIDYQFKMNVILPYDLAIPLLLICTKMMIYVHQNYV